MRKWAPSSIGNYRGTFAEHYGSSTTRQRHNGSRRSSTRYNQKDARPIFKHFTRHHTNHFFGRLISKISTAKFDITSVDEVYKIPQSIPDANRMLKPFCSSRFRRQFIHQFFSLSSTFWGSKNSVVSVQVQAWNELQNAIEMFRSSRLVSCQISQMLFAHNNQKQVSECWSLRLPQTLRRYFFWSSSVQHFPFCWISLGSPKN